MCEQGVSLFILLKPWFYTMSQLHLLERWKIVMYHAPSKTITIRYQAGGDAFDLLSCAD